RPGPPLAAPTGPAVLLLAGAPGRRGARRAPLAAPARAALGEMSQHDPYQQRDRDHDDQGRVPGADDPVDLDILEVQDREHRDKDRERDQSCCARLLAPGAARVLRLMLLG